MPTQECKAMEVHSLTVEKVVISSDIRFTDEWKLILKSVGAVNYQVVFESTTVFNQPPLKLEANL